MTEPLGPPPGGSRWTSLTFLIGVNLLPVGFLIFGDWSPGDVLIAFWLENVVVCGFTIVKIMTARGVASDDAGETRTRVGLAAFFTVQFGMFTFVHGIFTGLFAFWIGVSGSVGEWGVVVLGLVLSHGISLVVYWIRGGERDRTSPKEAMMAPYARIVVLHLVVIASAYVLINLANADSLEPGDPGRLLPALLLIAIKTAVDAVAHLRAHRRALPGATRAGPAPAGRAG